VPRSLADTLTMPLASMSKATSTCGMPRGAGLSDDEIKRMVSDAESHAEDDKRQRELAEARNTAENAAYQAERQLVDLGDTVDAASKEEIEAGIKTVRESLTGDDPADIKAKADALNASFHKVSEAMYQRAQEQQTADADADPASANGTTNGNGASAEEEDVVDAEVVDEGN
jgi:molecular chaperone DnaK